MKEVRLAHWTELQDVAHDHGLDITTIIEDIATCELFVDRLTEYTLSDIIWNLEDELPILVDVFKWFYDMHQLEPDVTIHWEYDVC